ncbi:MAG: methionine adenosyltransferase [Peptoniphilus sp.]|nr:methionine adenosyltransferase [Peptoniphilus sp.]MDY6045185.1 methionine adenosyltransferase [Peptoniphilus sp.]
MVKGIFTSESVTRGHPDKVCDQIADRILDTILRQDPSAHVACETTVCTDRVHIFGETTTTATVDYEAIARGVIAEIGYTEPGRGFDADNCEIFVDLHRQSPDIARGINRRCVDADRLNAGAGDQGMMFGYACNQTSSLMPMPIELAHTLSKRLEQVRRSGELPFLLPDGKSQVSVEYRAGKPARISSVVISAQHRDTIDIKDLREAVTTHIVQPTLPSNMLDGDTHIFINPTGRFVEGGPAADSGLTGRKLMVDTYGGYACHGGGAFSGKDASKVDRSGAYMARYMAKNIVAQGLASECEVQISYAIGLSDPMSVNVNTFGTGKITDELICRALVESTDLRPAAIIEKFDLTSPIFSGVSCYGHFGCNAANMPWEKTDLVLSL